MTEFLERFPDDPRAEQVRNWQQQRECRDLQRDLQNKLRSLSESEKLYLEGLQLAGDGQSNDACPCFQQIVEKLEASKPGELGATERRLLECARYLLEELKCPKPEPDEPPDQ